MELRMMVGSSVLPGATATAEAASLPTANANRNRWNQNLEPTAVEPQERSLWTHSRMPANEQHKG